MANASVKETIDPILVEIFRRKNQNTDTYNQVNFCLKMEVRFMLHESVSLLVWKFILKYKIMLARDWKLLLFLEKWCSFASRFLLIFIRRAEYSWRICNTDIIFIWHLEKNLVILVLCFIDNYVEWYLICSNWKLSNNLSQIFFLENLGISLCKIIKICLPWMD